MPESTPLSSIVMFFPDRPGNIKLDAQCRQLLVERALKVPDLDRQMITTATSSSYTDRQGVAKFLIAVPIETLQKRQEEWGQALLVGIEATADAMSCRPAWLSETFDSKPDPLGHVQSLLNAVDRFKGLPIHAQLTKAVQALANSTTHLNTDKPLSKLLRNLVAAGYRPVPPTP